jgi:DNA-binding CsgD family transcriptional regulator
MTGEHSESATARISGSTFVAGDAVLAFDEDLRIVGWNEAAERLTGVRRTDAIGRQCWDVLRAMDEDGNPVCLAGCSLARVAFSGQPPPARSVLVPTRSGRKRLTMATVLLGGVPAPRAAHLLCLREPASRVTLEAALTGRQLEVLRLLDDGLSTSRIATALGIAEATVRNHVRGIFAALAAHSRVEALAAARRRGLI